MRIWLLGAAALVGTAAHFLYVPLGRPRLLVMFLPVNESPWEHVKLCVWPLLGAVGLLSYFEGRPWPAVVTAVFVGAMHGMAAMLGLHYLLRFGFGDGTAVLWADILTYYVSLASGWHLALGLLPAPVPLGVGIFCGACLVLLAVFFDRGSLRPPERHVFRDLSSTKTKRSG